MKKNANIQTFENMILMSGSAVDHCALPGASDGCLYSPGSPYGCDSLEGYDLIVSIVSGDPSGGDDGPDVLVLIRDDDASGHGDATLICIRQAGQTAVEVTKSADGGVRVTTDDVTVYVGDSGAHQPGNGGRPKGTCPPSLPDPEYRTIDGTNNNLHDTDLGSTNERLIRLSDSEYSDGISDPGGDDRPSARSVSNELAAQREEGINDRGLTDVTWLWGQFLDHDISLSTGADPQEPFNIHVPSGDALFDPGFTGDAEIELNRTIFDPESGQSESDPREQINEITAWIDGSMVYGSDDARAAALRSFDGGRLKVTDENLLIFNDAGLPNAADGVPPGTQLFLAGDVRANENIALTAMHTLWVREHNRIADEIAAADPHTE